MITDKEIQILKEMHFHGEISESEFERRMEQVRTEEMEARENFMKAIAENKEAPKTMTEQDAVKYFKDYMDFCEKDGMGIPSKEPYNLAIAALEEVQKYREFEERLKKIYGDCPGLLELVVDHLEAHEGVDLPEPIFKARLLTDGNVDKWEAYKQLGTVEELREAMEKQRWIPCSERLPERNQPVIYCDERGIVGLALCTEKNTFWDSCVEFDDVIAWQPLPKPYMKVEKASSDSE